MNGAELAIAAGTIGDIPVDGTIENRLKEAFRRSFERDVVWMSHGGEREHDDLRFKAALAVVFKTATDEEKERIKSEVSFLKAINAASEGVPVDFEHAIKAASDGNPIGLMKLFSEVKESFKKGKS